MSWEGYYQHLCQKGHYWSKCAEYTEEDITCSICGSPVVWTNSVDTTNGSFEGEKRIDGYIDLKVKKETKCKECGHTLEITYKIPNQKKESSLNPYGVEVGQIWQDNDGRYQRWEPVYKRVLKIEGEYAYCQSYKQSSFCGQPFEIPTAKVKIKLNRFKPTNTGYRFVK